MTLRPKGDALRKAVQWISDKRKEKTEESLGKIIESACREFDLGPKDSDFLLRNLNDK